MRGGLVRGQRDRGQIEGSGDRLRDALERDAVFGHPVQHAARGGLLQGQAEQARRVEPMHRGPPVAAVADVGRHAGLSRGGDEHADEAVIPGAVDGGGEPDHARAYSLGGEAQARSLARDPESGDPGRVGFVPLGGLPAEGHDQRAGGAHERLARTRP